MPLDVNTFAEKIKAKHPEYKNVDNQVLAEKMVEKYPEYKTKVDLSSVKKKEVTESDSEGGSSATQKVEKPKPSVSSDGSIYTGYPGKESKKYRYDENTNSWYEYSHTDASEKGNVDRYEKTITDPGRVNALNKYFKKQASTTTKEQVFTGYPGKETNQYVVRNGNWYKKQKGSEEWVEVLNKGAINSLNNQFGQNVKGFKYESAVVDIASETAKEVGKYINKSEETTVEELRNKFKGTENDIFDFQETGIGNMLKITNKKTGADVTIDLDGSENERKILEAFIQSNLKFKDYNNLIQSKNKLEAERLNPTRSIIIIDQELKDINDKIKEEEFKRKAYALEKGTYMSTAMYGKDKAKNIEESFNQSQSKLTKDLIVFKNEAKEFTDYQEQLREDFKNGLITEDQYNEKINDPTNIALKNQLKEKQEQIKADAQDAINSNELRQKILAESLVSKEQRGDMLSNIVSSFTWGFMQTPRLLATDEALSRGKYDDELTKSDLLADGVITEEYMKSDKLGDLEKALAGVFESLGAAMSTPVPSGVGGIGLKELFKKRGVDLITNVAKKVALHPSEIGLYSLTYLNFKDQINSDPSTADMDEADKVILSATYGLVSAKLEKLGMGKWFSKTQVGQKATSYIMKKAFKGLPKDATSEMIEERINSSIKGAIAKNIISLGAKGNIEGATEALQELADISLKAIYNEIKGEEVFKNPSFSEAINRMGESYKLGLIGGVAMSTLTQAVNTVSDVRTANQKKVLNELINSPELRQSFEDDLRAKVINNEITKEEAQSQIDELNRLTEIKDKMPNNMASNQEAFDLLEEKNKLENEIQGKEETLVVSQKERITEINDRLTELGKTKEDAVQEQTTDEGVLRQEQSEMGLPEVEQGNQEQEVVAQEGEEKVEPISSSDIKTNIQATTDGLNTIKDDDAFNGITLKDDRFNYGVESENINNGENTLVRVRIPIKDKRNGRPGGAAFSFILPKGISVSPEQILQKINEINEDIKLTAFRVDDQVFNENVNTIESKVMDFIVNEHNKNITQPVQQTEQSEKMNTEEEISIEQVKQSTGQKALDWLDNLDNKLSEIRDPKNFNDVTRVIPAAALQVIVKAVKASVKAGMTVSQAIDDYFAKNKEYTKADFEESITNLSKVKSVVAQSAKDEKKAFKEGKKEGKSEQEVKTKEAKEKLKKYKSDTKEGRQTAKDYIRGRLAKSKFVVKTRQFKAMLNKALDTNFANPEMVERLNAYIDKVAERAENIERLNEANKLRKAFRKAKWQHPTVAAAKLFSKVDPVMVENLDEYMDLANKLKGAVRTTSIAKGQLREATNLNAIEEYASKEIARQEDIKKANFIAKFEDKIKDLIKDYKSLSYSELKDKLKDDVDSESNDVSKFIQEIKDISSDMQDEISKMLGVPDSITELSKANIDSLSNKELVELYEILNNYIVNETAAGAKKLSTIIKSNNRKRLLSKSPKFNKVKFKGKLNRLFLGIRDLSELEEKLLGGTENRIKMRRIIGFDKFDRAKELAEKRYAEITNEYNSKFGKIKGFSNPVNVVIRDLAGRLNRNVDTEFEIRKNNLLLMPEMLRSTKKESDIKKAELYEEAFKKVGLKEATKFEDLKIESYNMEALNFVQKKAFGENYEKLKAHASEFYNKDLSEDQNYTPDRWRKLSANRQLIEELLDGFTFQDLGNINKKMPNVLIDSKTPKLQKGTKFDMYIDLDFEYNWETELLSSLKSLYLDEHIISISNILDSKEFDSLFNSGDLRDDMFKAYTDYINMSMGRFINPGVLRTDLNTSHLLDNIATISSARVLASPRQYLKNTVPVMIDTFINLLPYLAKGNMVYKPILTKSQNSFIDRIPYAISRRGKDAFTGLQNEIKISKLDSSNPKIIEKLAWIANKKLDLTMGVTDRVVSRSAFMSFYLSELKSRGVNTSGIDWDTHVVNENAAEVAQSMVDRLQRISDKDKKSQMQKNLGKIMGVIMPFSSFVISAKMRMRNDIATIFNKSSEISGEARGKAVASFFGMATQLTTFAAVSNLASELVFTAVDSISGDDDDEDIDFWSKFTKRVASQTVLDALSPIPFLDPLVAIAYNKGADLITDLFTTDNEIKQHIDEEQEKEYEKHSGEKNVYGKYTFTQEKIDKMIADYIEKKSPRITYFKNDDEVQDALSGWGQYGILPSKTIDMISTAAVYKNMKYEDKYGNIKYIPEEAYNYVKNSLIFKNSSLALGAEGDFISNRLERSYKKYALTGSQKTKYDEVKDFLGSSRNKFSEKDIILIKKTNLSVREISSIISGTKEENKVKEYKRLIEELGAK